MTPQRLAIELGRHLLIGGDGYHHTRRCTCGWTTRETDAAGVHRLHVAEAVLSLTEEA